MEAHLGAKLLIAIAVCGCLSPGTFAQDSMSSNATDPPITAPTPLPPEPAQTVPENSAATSAPMPGPAAQPAKAGSGLEDYTNKLKLVPGMSIVFPIRNGIDTHRKPIGDYDFTALVDKATNDEFVYDWTMSSPPGAVGSRAVAPEDLKKSDQVSLFYSNGQSCTMSGFMNTVRVSDALFSSMKKGQRSAFRIDLDDSKDIPESVRPVGREYVPVEVDGKKVRVRTIKIKTDNGWNYWIMDNAKFPVMVQGTGPFSWAEPRFSTAGIEAKRIVKNLELNGEATTYAILFAFNSAQLQNNSKLILNEIARYLNAKKEVHLKVEGHCDIVGQMQYNMVLSQRRAEAVKNYLVSKGIAANRLEPHGYGYTRPIASNLTAQGRAKNRRVVFRKI